jgi:8-oxo-dGTP pyrophosphatase MutT (NUDIX family)
MPHILDMVDVIRQAGALPFRKESVGLRVLLITSRQSGRWVIPKGHIDKGFSPAEAAAQEAFEEAGLRGLVSDGPIGAYEYAKRLRGGRVQTAIVDVFALEVIKQVKKWPEQGERRFEWMDPLAAALAVQEPGLAEILRRFHAARDHALPIAG